jgi:adenosylmethionine-8-amino-7-oxononanoate aminotransferase
LCFALKLHVTEHAVAYTLSHNFPLWFQVLGLENAYHGDTLGAMDCVALSVYNGRLQAPWYRGRGVFLKPPYLAIVKGR